MTIPGTTVGIVPVQVVWIVALVTGVVNWQPPPRLVGVRLQVALESPGSLIVTMLLLLPPWKLSPLNAVPFAVNTMVFPFTSCPVTTIMLLACRADAAPDKSSQNAQAAIASPPAATGCRTIARSYAHGYSASRPGLARWPPA